MQRLKTVKTRMSMDIEDQVKYIKTHLERPIVIIGMMGAGKTTLGRRISEILEWPFFDSDHEIEAEQSLSVREIFETQGEAAFRDLEKSKIAELVDRASCILSVGGGAITTPETADTIFSKSLCLWIDAPIKVLAERTSGQGTRPLLEGKNVEGALTERMGQRKHLYERAAIHVDGSSDIETVSHNAIGQIYNYLIEKAHGI